ncbi:uncharacterized protein LOC143215908 [Lasioglossum baleicum]|uniref:uncharacterized protein LOC143215908 n=1 Tax=Lasioglossum baleicum TaxID=434251 RepID=UPI003FCCA38C
MSVFPLIRSAASARAFGRQARQLGKRSSSQGLVRVRGSSRSRGILTDTNSERSVQPLRNDVRIDGSNKVSKLISKRLGGGQPFTRWKRRSSKDARWSTNLQL